MALAGVIAGISGCNNEVALQRTDPKVWADYLEQPAETTNLDVLVVLDTSCSMYDDYDRVGSGLVTLRNDIDGLVENSNFGFITTSVANPDFHGPFDSSQTLDILMTPAQLEPQMDNEAGFGSMYSWYNGGQTFLRDDASLLTIFISDEEEQSGLSPDLWYDEFLSGIKVDENGDPVSDKMDVIAITTLPGPGQSCDSSVSSDIGCNYIKLVRDHYNKEPVDLMSPGWEDWLAGASFLTRIEEQIALTHQPIVNSIKVYVNGGNPISAADWDYLPETNIVRLNFTPEHEDDIVVAYNYRDS